MSASYPCFFIEPTGRRKLFLRRYRSSATNDNPCTGAGRSYHDARVFIGEDEEKRTEEGYVEAVVQGSYEDDPRWPAKCDACDYQFNPADEADQDQVFGESIYRRADTGELMTLHDAPPGAIWNAFWYVDWHKGPDGLCLVCRMPGGHDWMIDGRASNCDSICGNCGKPYHCCTAMNADKVKSPNEVRCKGFVETHPHQCWVRTGTVLPMTLDVTKGAPGESCHAGAGSIVVPGWHGFLRHGVLVPC